MWGRVGVGGQGDVFAWCMMYMMYMMHMAYIIDTHDT